MSEYVYSEDGLNLSMDQMKKIDKYYRSALIASYVEDNYHLSQDDAMNVGNCASELVEKYGLGREEAIDDAMEELGFDLRTER